MKLTPKQKVIQESVRHQNFVLDNMAHAISLKASGSKTPAETIHATLSVDGERHIHSYAAEYPTSFQSKKGGFEASVAYSSTETDDKKLLHLLHKNYKD